MRAECSRYAARKFAQVSQFSSKCFRVRLSQRQIDKNGQGIVDTSIYLDEERLCFGFRALEFRRIGKTPMRSNRLAWPHRAGFTRGLIADSNDKIHGWGILAAELIPALGSQIRYGVLKPSQQRQRMRVDAAGRMTTGTIGRKTTLSDAIEDGLCHDAATGIAGTQEQDLIYLI